ncbi:hypothetical protein V1506DRAFT_561953 [Lipomyces tetrasporus]
MENLKALDYLGQTANCLEEGEYGVNANFYFSKQGIVDTTSVQDFLNAASATLVTSSETKTDKQWTYTVNGKPVTRRFTFPDNVHLSQGTSIDGSLILCHSGSEAKSSVVLKADVSASYMGASISGSVKSSTSSQYKESSMYAFYSFDERCYTAALRINTAGQHLDSTYTSNVLKLPSWNSSDQDTINKYVEFFDIFGTHAITAATYGWRCQITVECGKSDQINEADFDMSVKASYSGVASISGDASVKTQNYYHAYSASSNSKTHVVGGDPGLLTDAVSTNAADPEETEKAFAAWRASNAAGKSEDICNVHLVPVAEILRLSADQKVIDKATDLEKAVRYLAICPPVAGFVRVTCQLKFWADWANITFDDPDPGIQIDVNNLPSDLGRLDVSPKRIGASNDGLFETVPFYLFLPNSGKTAFSFTLRHGQRDPNNWCSATFLDESGNQLGFKYDARDDGFDNAVPYDLTLTWPKPGS